MHLSLKELKLGSVVNSSVQQPCVIWIDSKSHGHSTIALGVWPATSIEVTNPSKATKTGNETYKLIVFIRLVIEYGGLGINRV